MRKAELDQSKFWTEAEYLALKETNSRIELLDGRLQVTPPTNNAHDEIADLAWSAFRGPARAAGLRIFTTPGIRLRPRRIVSPDLAIGSFRRNASVNDAADTLLVLEVLSPSNASTDRGRKKRFYADAKIPWYLIIEPDFTGYESVVVRLHRLDGDNYVEHAVAKQGETLALDFLPDAVLNTDDLIDL